MSIRKPLTARNFNDSLAGIGWKIIIFLYFILFFTEYLIELHQLHPVFTLWATSEPELNQILIAIAKAVENNASAHQTVLDSFPDDMREYLSYIDAVRDALARRDSMQIEYELTIDELTKKRQEKDQVG